VTLSTLSHQSRGVFRRAALVAVALSVLAAIPVIGASGWRTDDPAYYLPSSDDVEITPILTVGEGVDGYEMVGVPDGLGAFDNSRRRGYDDDDDDGRRRRGTFTLLMNHELGPAQGTVRDHGATGAFISRWVINKRDLSVVSGDDQIKQVFVQDPVSGAWSPAAAYAFDRFCSADLPAQSALSYRSWGTRELIYLNGEERRPPFSNPPGGTAENYGHAWAHIATGSQNGRTYELNDLGEMSFENVVASPYPQRKTVVVGLDDSTNAMLGAGYNPQNPPSEVYVYVGHKRRSGNPVERAGLSGGDLFGIKVKGDPTETTITGGEHFDLALMSDAAQDTGGVLQSESAAKGVTQFRRVEDGQWDPTNRNHFYFVTTDQFGGITRLWLLDFKDVRRPELGGRIHIALDSPAGVPGEMFDNMTVDRRGRVLLQEDPGNNAYLAKIWVYDPDDEELTEVAAANPAEFSAPGNLDEESSGIIDVSHILGRGMFLFDVQAHRPPKYNGGTVAEHVEDGQLLAMEIDFGRGDDDDDDDDD
jgi:hypothetical protein